MGVASGFAGIIDLLRLPKDGPGYKAGTRHVLLTDVALVLYGISLFLRRGTDYSASIKPLQLHALTSRTRCPRCRSSDGYTTDLHPSHWGNGPATDSGTGGTNPVTEE